MREEKMLRQIIQISIISNLIVNKSNYNNINSKLNFINRFTKIKSIVI